MVIRQQTRPDPELLDSQPCSPGRMTEDEFIAWCDEDTKAEWVGGSVIMLAPASLEHSDLGGWLASVLRAFVEHHDLGEVLADVSDPSQAPASGTDEYRRLEERDGVISSRVLSGLALRVAWLWPPGRPKLVEALRQLGLLGTAPG